MSRARSEGMQPAFAMPASISADARLINEEHYGLSKRELIAAMALQGMLAGGRMEPKDGYGYSSLPEQAVQYADRLLVSLYPEEESR